MITKAPTNPLMTIGEVARTAGVATLTLRYYEQEGMRNLQRVQEALGHALDRCQRSNGECRVLKEISPTRKRR